VDALAEGLIDVWRRLELPLMNRALVVWRIRIVSAIHEQQRLQKEAV
jgi:hypothetical protein